jgi:F1F0 ATPase subunit 2
MTDFWTLAPALGAGCLLGIVFYGGLWWTVRKGMSSVHPALWFFSSFWLRLGIALAGFYVVANGDWKRMLACLAGFIIARVAALRLTRERAHAH